MDVNAKALAAGGDAKAQSYYHTLSGGGRDRGSSEQSAFFWTLICIVYNNMTDVWE